MRRRAPNALVGYWSTRIVVVACLFCRRVSGTYHDTLHTRGCLHETQPQTG